MEKQTIFFKEISKLNLFDLKSENRIDLAKNFRLKLVANSNKFGIVAFGFNNVIKIYNTNEFESVTDNQVPNHIATVNLEQGNKFVHIEFNRTQTHLIALVINLKREQNFEYFLNVYAMETIKVDANNSQQSPVLLNRIALENDNSRINDLLVSPKDGDLVILSKENGKIEIISKILDQNYKINSKQMNALCICWSPTGKNFAYCSKDKCLSLNSLDFEMKYKYQCLENDLEPNSIKWLAKKEFLVSYNDAENNPRIFYHEILKNQNGLDTFSKEEFDGVVFATGEQNDISWINFQNLNEFNLILCAYSKCPEIGVLVKDNNSKYQLLFLEEFRPNLPMSSNANDVFPIGIEISLNSQKEIDFDSQGKQPPSPLLFCLADTGFLSTFYVINMTMFDKKVCKAAEKLPYTQIKASLLPTPEPNMSIVQKDSILSPINSQASFQFKSNEQKTTAPSLLRNSQITSESKENVPSQSISFFQKDQLIHQQQAPNNLPNFEQSKENVPSQSISFFQKDQLIHQQQAPNNLPNFEQSKENVPSQSISFFQKDQLIHQQQAPNNLPNFEQSKENVPSQSISFFQKDQLIHQQQAPNNLPNFEQSKENLPSQSISFFQKDQLIHQQQAPNNLPKEILQNAPTAQLPSPTITDFMRQQLAKIETKLLQPNEKDAGQKTDQMRDNILTSFDREMQEFRESVKKLFNGKDLPKNLVDLKIIKETKNSMEIYKKLNEEIVQFDEICSNTRSCLFTNFNNLEMLRFLKFNIENKKGISLINQFDHDPFIKSRYENIKAMYTKFDLEMTDLKERSGYRRYETKFNSYREIYAKICALDKNVTERNRKLNRIMEQLKSTRVGKNALHECNLSSPRKKDDENSPYINSILDRIKKKGELNMLSGKMSDLNLDKEMSQKCEKNSKLNSQLYDKLKKRNTVPKQVVNIGQLESIASKYIESKSTQVPLNDTSFLHFNQASPNVSRVLDSSVQHKPAQIPIQQMPQLREIHTPLQPKFNQSALFMNQVHQKENESLTTSTPAPSSSTPFFSGFGQTAKSSIPDNLAYAVQQTQSQVVDKPIVNFSLNPTIQTEIKAKTSQPQITTSQSHSILENNKPKPKTTETKLHEEKKQQPSIHDQKPQTSQTTKQFESKEATKFVMNEIAPKLPEKKDIPWPEFNSIHSKPDEIINKKLTQSNLNPPEPVTKNEDVEKKSLIPQLNVAPKQLVKLPEQQNSQLFKTSEASFPVEKKNESTILSKSKEQAFASSDANVKSFEPVNMEKKSSTSKINSGPNQLAGQDLANSGTNFATGDSKPAAGISFSSGFANNSGSTFGAKTESKPALLSNFSLTKAATIPSQGKEKEQLKSNIGLDAGKSDKQLEKKENFGIEQSENIKQLEKDVKATESSDSKSAETEKKNELFGVSSSFPLCQTENLTKSDMNRDKKEEKKTDTHLFGLLQENKPSVFDKSSFGKSATSQFSFKINQVKAEDKTDTNAENTKPIVEEPKNEKVQETPLFGSKTNFLTEQKSADQTKEPAKQNENLFTSFSTGDSKPAAGISFGSGFSNASVSIFGANTESKPAFPSTFSSTKSVDNPFAAIASQKQSAAEIDADMDSSSVVSSNNGLSFGGFGLGSSKPINEPIKNVFGGTQFTASFTKETFKPAFGGSVIKNATFSTSTQQTTGTTGFANISSSTTTTNTGGNLFSTFNSPTKPTFGATSTFGGSPGFGQPAAFGGPATFGAPSALGANSTFGSTSTTANTPTFGALSSGTAPSFGGFGQSSSNTENGFGTLAAQNQSGSLFSSFTTNSGTGFSNNSSFTSYRK